MSSVSETETTLSIPSLLFVAALSFFAIRYFFSRSSSSQEDSRQINPAHLDQISQMFPDLDRRSIMWDLRRNGGNMAATVERVMQGRGLDRPPPSFQPIFTPPTTQNPTGATSTSSSPFQISTSTHPDLITRYNLQSRVSNSDKGKAPVRDHVTPNNISIGSGGGGGGGGRGEGAGGEGWGKTKEERSEILLRRRDEMILKARRKMMDRQAEEGG